MIAASREMSDEPTILHMEHTDYEDFLAERRKLMAQKIKKYYYSL